MKARLFVARHGETVFNAARRMQGRAVHTPLTRAGFHQAEAMGAALRSRLGPRPAIDIWSSPSGRALQTLAVIAEHLELDWHSVRTDARLSEIDVGAWSGLPYREVEKQSGPLLDPGTGLFTRRPPEGEWYDEVARRLQSWLDDFEAVDGQKLVVMHGMSSRVLRGLLTEAPLRPECGARIADSVPQGSVVEIADGVEAVLAGVSGRD